MSADAFYALGITLIVMGIIVVLVALLLFFISSIRGRAQINGGGAILIGPFPIVFGTDKESIKTVILLSILLTIMLLVLTVVFYMLFK